MGKIKTIYFIGGFPRSGSTLLTELLNQNPQFHASKTSGLIQLLNMIRNNWTLIDAFQSVGIEKTLPKMRSLLRGALESFYGEEFDQDLIVFNKDRAILNNIEFLEEVLGYEVKIITCIRDVKDIVSSFEKLNRKNTLIKNNLYGENGLSIYSRSSEILSPTGVVGNCVSMLRDCFQKGYSDRLVILPFGHLTNDPKNTMEELHNMLNLPSFEYDFNNVLQTEVENDFIYGIPDLHKVNKVVKHVESDALEILGEQICKEIDESFGDIKKLLG